MIQADDITVEALEADPYPIYARLRDEAPVCFVPAVGAWLVTGWDDVTYIAAHPELFGAPSESPLRATLGENVLTVHGEAHKRMRAAMEPALRWAPVDAYAPALVEQLTSRLIDPLVDRGSAELMAELFEPASVLSLGHVLGLGDLDAPLLRRWFAELAAGGSNYEGDPDKHATGTRASAEIDAVAGPIVDRLAREPDDSLLSAMLRHLTRAEVMANLKLIVLGGMQEPGHAAGMTTWALLTHPEQARLVRDDPSLAGAAVEETLRWLSPVGTATREVLAPVTLGGVELAPGERVAAVLAAANRDPRRFDDPDRFDLRRPEAKHRAFGIGGHFCVGHWLARHEVRIPVEVVFRRLPGLRLHPDRPVVMRGWEFRGPQRLDAVWDR